MLVLWYSCNFSAVGCSQTVAISLTAIVLTILEKSVFYEQRSVSSVSLGLLIQFVHCCSVNTRTFMPAIRTVVLYTIVEISEFLGQLPVDYDNEKSQLNPSIASLRLE